MDSPFYETERKYLARIAHKAKLSPEEVEDVVQAVWLLAVKHRADFVGTDIEGRVRAWLRKAIVRRAKDARRRLALRHCESLDAKRLEPINDPEAKRADLKDLGECLNALLERVRPGHEESHRLLCAHYFHKRSIKELAEESGKRVCAIDSCIRRHAKRLLAAAARDPSGAEMRERFRAMRVGREKLRKI